MFVVDWRNIYRRYLIEYARIVDDIKDKNVRWNNDYYYEEEYDGKLLVDVMDLIDAEMENMLWIIMRQRETEKKSYVKIVFPLRM